MDEGTAVVNVEANYCSICGGTLGDGQKRIEGEVVCGWCYEDEEIEDRPTVKLLGRDGNAYAILGACQSAARKAGWGKDRIDSVMDEMMAGDYDNLLATAMKYFDVE